ncbi:hypothetical protein IE53DRAFT_343626 [Violaceomyces palustris]|uniref:Uncharacterized protein n=1 Tax=Violaceomyces palustris TaxID=1673888 RepID=A0ACD0NY64_9BASI|nr:hypothetical protein IE53DRAFT_343626 [Violaceomyces palustris]
MLKTALRQRSKGAAPSSSTSNRSTTLKLRSSLLPNSLASQAATIARPLSLSSIVNNSPSSSSKPGPSATLARSAGLVASRVPWTIRSSPSAPRFYATVSQATTTSSSQKPLPDKILIANRGEIACRVMRTCKKLGIKTVAVFSEADRNAMHVKQADEAYCIGPAPSSDSYLRMDKIVAVAKSTGAKMIHPGYGFLSENASFAELLKREGIEFIGPPASAIESMGSKSASKEIMIQAGVPCVPGYHGKDQSVEKLKQEANKAGYPILIKAVKGGGGKGMKVVRNESEFEDQLESARREAQKSFGDTDVLIEKYLERPRHVEVQVFCDKHGGAVYVWERDCSVQRRHQKIIEEAPAPGLPESLRRELGEKAVAAAKAVNYVGAGTVEFILDAETLEFFFMEMNTRLQVEHPVSEMISGQDLVEWQLEVASGNPLPLSQEEMPLVGHAFEARIYAENTRANFLPDVGTLRHVKLPSLSENVRVDTGFDSGDEISVHYDPMIAKLIVKGRDRQEALRVLTKALDEYEVVGPATNIEFLKNLANHHAFIEAKVETGFIPKYGDELQPPIPRPSVNSLAQAALFIALRDVETEKQASSDLKPSAWQSASLSSFRVSSSQPIGRKIQFVAKSSGKGAKDASTASDKSELTSDGQGVVTDGLKTSTSEGDGVEAKSRLTTSVIGRKPDLSSSSRTNETLDLFLEGRQVRLELASPEWLAEVLGKRDQVEGSLIAPMPSKVVDVRVKQGDRVEEGQVLVVLEAMKTEHSLRSPKSGVVKSLNSKCSKGEMVPEGLELVVFED